MASFFSCRALIGALTFYLWLPVVGRSQAPVAPTTPDKADPSEALDYVEQLPEYPGGNSGIVQFMGQNVKYPARALRDAVQGKVSVNFIVDETGQVIEPIVMRGIGSGCDAEAVRVVRNLGRFRPGKQNGKPVKVYYNLPIMFAIPGEPPVVSNPAYRPDPGVVYGETQVPVRQRGLIPTQEKGLYSQPLLPSGTRGAVRVDAVVDRSGRILRAHVFARHSRAADSVALQLVKKAKKWLPAEQGGEVVSAVLRHYVLFGVERRPEVFYAPEQAAVYSGPLGVSEHITQTLRYPEAARKAKRSGSAFVRVVIDTNGQVTEPEIVKSAGAGLDEEALRVVQTLGMFEPAQHGGQLVASYLIVPVNFNLP